MPDIRVISFAPMLAFIDESGHPHPNDASTRPVLAAVCFAQRDSRSINRQIFRIKRALLGDERAGLELKAHDLLKRSTFRRRPELRELVESVFDHLPQLTPDNICSHNGATNTSHSQTKHPPTPSISIHPSTASYAAIGRAIDVRGFGGWRWEPVRRIIKEARTISSQISGGTVLGERRRHALFCRLQIHDGNPVGRYGGRYYQAV